MPLGIFFRWNIIFHINLPQIQSLDAHWGSSNEYQKSLFYASIRKTRNLLPYKMWFTGSTFYGHVNIMSKFQLNILWAISNKHIQEILLHSFLFSKYFFLNVLKDKNEPEKWLCVRIIFRCNVLLGNGC